ncbi:hypothetical protein EV401DRAFT_558131 [Pisolithus croceorrhizus]|nr:hypothetical protein EV401DRAFT_558131 [Pisolithus croceorrhizus]
MAEFETMVVNPAPSVYLQTHRLIAECMAGEHPAQAHDILAEVSALLLRIRHDGGGRVSHLMLQSLEHWMPHLHVAGRGTLNRYISQWMEASQLTTYSLSPKDTVTQSRNKLVPVWARLVEVPGPTLWSRCCLIPSQRSFQSSHEILCEVCFRGDSMSFEVCCWCADLRRTVQYMRARENAAHA